MRRSEELFKIAGKMSGMKPAVIVGYLKAIYKEGYKDGCDYICNQLGLEDGDIVKVIDETGNDNEPDDGYKPIRK